MAGQDKPFSGVLKEGENAKELGKEEWKKRLTPLQYQVTREAGTEEPFTGEYDRHFEKGLYACSSCGVELFESDSKYQTTCGWPSFSVAKDEKLVERRPDLSENRVRTEVLCTNCNAHLGHVFNDGPMPRGERYCINSVCLQFKSS